jgi:drug/metabolite transporter (DMT)-like permease
VKPRTVALAAAAMCAFAANSLLCRAALAPGAIDPFTFTLARIASGALVLALIVRGAAPAAVPRPWALAAALFGYAIAFSLAYTRIPAAVGALALFGSVQAGMIGWGALSGQAPSPREWLGLVLALGGLVGLTLPGLSAPDPLGFVLMVAAGLCWAVYSLLGRAAGAPLRANAASFTRAAAMAATASLLGAALTTPQASTRGLALAILSGAVTSGLGYVVWYAALRGMSATQGALVQLSVAPLAAAGAVTFLGERPGGRLLACGLLILGGIALALTARRLRPAPRGSTLPGGVR